MLNPAQTSTRQVVASLLFLFTFLVSQTGLAQQEEGHAFAGSQACASCHMEEHEAWVDSHHGWALREANPENVLGLFDGETREISGVTSRFLIEDGRYFAELQDIGGEPERWEVLYTIGVEPLQQYMVETRDGALQVLDIAWDTQDGRWFHLYPDDVTTAEDGLHWTGPYKNWQARCASCHQTDFTKNYDPLTGAYQSTWSDLTVGCEACHGAAREHVAEAIAWAGDDPESDQLPYSLTTGLVDFTVPGVEAETCAACHARRSSFAGDSVPPGEPFADHFGLSLLSDGLYHADGQIDAEVYVYGSFVQSRMAQAGVTCSNCHDPHSGDLVAEGNGVCTQCHNPEGSTEFPSAPSGAFDSAEHHHHDPMSEAGQCVACHMPAQNYMLIDPRRDHSFRIPRPDVAASIGAPDACTSCHVGQDQDWAARTIRSWYPEGQWNTPHFGTVLHAGRNDDSEAVRTDLLALAGDTTQPGIVRASAIQLLGQRLDVELGPQLYVFLEDADPIVRTATVNALRVAPPGVRATIVAPLQADPVRSVRIAAAFATLDLSTDGLTPEEIDVVAQARGEMQAMLRELADFPETQMQIGGMALTLRNLDFARAAYGEAVRMDPQQIDAWMMLGRIGLTAGDLDEVERHLAAARAVNPDDVTLMQSHGNILSDLGRLDEAQAALAMAVAASPMDPFLRHDLAITQSRRGEDNAALTSLLTAQTLGARDAEFLELLAITQMRLGMLDEAAATFTTLTQSYPDFVAADELNALDAP